MKRFVIVLSLAFLMSCNGYVGSAKTLSSGVQLDGELSECKIYPVHINGFLGQTLYVVKCGCQTSTHWTTSCGKNCTRTYETAVDTR